MSAPPPVDGPVAILGWGSLIWDLEILAPHVAGPWRTDAGPRLSLEFSRISKKRRNGLVLALDLVDGDLCATQVIPHRGAKPGEALAAAQADLAARERAPLSKIGWATTTAASRAEDATVAAIQAWLPASGFAGAVWTDLEVNFEAVAGQPFGLAAAEAHLQTLDGEDRAEAVRYIHRAPPATDTPLRRRLAARPWWREAVLDVEGG